MKLRDSHTVIDIIHGHIDWIKRNWKLFLSVSLFSVVILFATHLRFHMISGAMPYPGHNDEVTLVSRAGNILKKGDFNPHFFRYPSLPIYMTAAAFTVGYLDAAAHLELQNISLIPTEAFPFFNQPRVVWPAKALFTIFSVFSLLFIGIIAYRAYGNPLLLFLVPLILSLSHTYFVYSHKYLNVDIVGAFFITAVYFSLFTHMQRDTFLHKSFIPGLLSGLALASKYNLFWIIIPSIFTIVLCSRRQRAGKIILLLVIVFLTFLLVVPYSILDFKTFLNDIGAEVYHYKKGHTGIEGSVGFAQFIYYLSGDAPGGEIMGQGILKDFGYWTSILAIIGLIAALLKNWKNTVILASFPVALLWYMSTQKARFIRNIVSLYIFYALFAAIGLITLYRLLLRASQKLASLRLSEKRKRLGITGLLGLVFVLVFPVHRPVEWARTKPESRNLAVQWIGENLDKGSLLVVPEELSMNVRPLQKNYRVIKLRFKELDKEKFAGKINKLEDPYVLMPFFSYDPRERPGERLANELNNLFEEADTLITFTGEEGVLVNFSQPVPRGNPRFSICRIKDDQIRKYELQRSLRSPGGDKAREDRRALPLESAGTDRERLNRLRDEREDQERRER